MTKARDLASNAEGTKPKVIDAAGDLIYGTGSDAATRLAIGTAGQVLQVNSGATAPEWADASGAPSGYTLITSGTFGADTGITFSSLSNNSKYLVIFEAMNPSSGNTNNILLRPNNDSGSNYHYWGRADWNEARGGDYRYALSETSFLTSARLKSGNSSNWQRFLIDGANSSDFKHISYQATYREWSTDSNVQTHMEGLWKNTSAITSLNFTWTTALTAGGNYYLFGKK